MIPISNRVFDLARFFRLLILKTFRRNELMSGSLFHSYREHFHVRFQNHIHFLMKRLQVSYGLNMVKNFQKMRDYLIDWFALKAQILFDLC